PLLLDSDGKGGFHIWTLFDRPVPAAKAFAFGKYLVRNWAAFGLGSEPESFPKSPTIRDRGKELGPWLRGPGRHHKREHWARAWDFEAGGWHDAAGTIAAILGTRGDSPTLIPAAALEPAKAIAKPPPAPRRPGRPRRQPAAQRRKEAATPPPEAP